MDGKANVLLVDDRPANLTAMQAVLEPLGQTLLTAHSGEEALKLLLEHEVAVILLDVNMPGMDGFATAKLIRQRERSRHMPIIFLTAYDRDPSKIIEGYQIGAVDFIFKPVEVDEIVRSKVSVFVELYQARLREQDLEAEQRRVRELEAELDHYQSMGASSALPVGEMLYGSTPIHRTSDPAFDGLVGAYGQVLEQAVESQTLRVDHGTAEQLRQLADSLGGMQAGPRDVVELHRRALATRTKNATSSRARALVEEGRFLVLELMGYLAAFYRKYYSGSRAIRAEAVSNPGPFETKTSGGSE